MGPGQKPPGRCFKTTRSRPFRNTLQERRPRGEDFSLICRTASNARWIDSALATRRWMNESRLLDFSRKIICLSGQVDQGQCGAEPFLHGDPLTVELKTFRKKPSLASDQRQRGDTGGPFLPGAKTAKRRRCKNNPRRLPGAPGGRPPPFLKSFRRKNAAGLRTIIPVMGPANIPCGAERFRQACRGAFVTSQHPSRQREDPRARRTQKALAGHARARGLPVDRLRRGRRKPPLSAPP